MATEIRTLTFRGATFRHSVLRNLHASGYTFEDEQHVRDQFWHVKPGDVVLDVGACFGSYTLPALALGGFVYAFEPKKAEADLLAENLQLNHFIAGTVLPYGLHGRDGWADPDDGTWYAEDAPGRVPVRTLTGFLRDQGIDRVDWLKVDAEGAELDILREGAEALRRLRPRIIVECHNYLRGGMTGEVRRLLASWGYKVLTGPFNELAGTVLLVGEP